MGRKILLIDDSELALNVCKAALESAGFEVETVPMPCVPRAVASSLAESLSVEGAAPDLILMDVMMPGMAGDEMTKLFKKTFNIDVLVYLNSDLDVEELEKRAAASGANGYISKTQGLDHLVERVLEILS